MQKMAAGGGWLRRLLLAHRRLLSIRYSSFTHEKSITSEEVSTVLTGWIAAFLKVRLFDEWYWRGLMEVFVVPLCQEGY